MSLFADLTDGVPVKISDKFKPPPRIELGRSILESETRARHTLDTVGYDFGFDGRVVAKITELRAARESGRSERRHRLRLLDEAKQRRLDEIAAAAEAAERVQQLSVAHVSYPSTDDMIETAASPQNDQAPLLCPVRLPQPSLTHPLDSDPLDDIRRTIPRPLPISHRDLTHLTISDFVEHNTASPFDELELSSINDLEQLAQVLRNETATQCTPEKYTCPITEPVQPVHYGYYTCPVPSYAYLPQATQTMRTRCRGVSDIINELSDELIQQRRRAEEAIVFANQSALNTSPPAVTSASQPPSVSKQEKLPDLYNELPPRLQEMCRRVQGMGFPRERVARVISLVGDSDKKVVEALLLIGQLLDLGFPEGRVAAALAKHQFNRDKALDDLIA